MTRWDLVSQALRLDAVRQSQLVAHVSILSRRSGQHRHRLAEVDRREDRCPRPSMPAPVSASVPGTEWQRAILGLGAAFSALPQTSPVAA